METIIAQDNTNQDRLDFISFQAQLTSIANLRFIYTCSFNWWSYDFAKFSSDFLLEQWINSFEQSYGEMLGQSAIQQMLGKQVNLAVREWPDDISRL